MVATTNTHTATTLDALLGIEFPFIQGGMANIATGTFAAAVSNAGAMGVIATGGIHADALREQIHICRSLTDKPFGVNLMLMHREIEEIAQIVTDEQVPFITTGAGSPGKWVPQWKEAGSLVYPVVPSVALAKRLVGVGADGVIAEGTESGGHVGELTTMALVPQVVDAVDVPVVAAGGIASGRQYLAARALGAIGAQVGTCLLVSQECPIHDNYKQALLKAADTGTIVFGRIAGTPVRALKNQMARAYVKQEKEGATKEELEEYVLGALRRAVNEGDLKTGSFMAGQVAGQLHEIRPLRAIFEELHRDAVARLGQLEGASL
jgi:enoyl-[acyl-carrier protein] reductase II